MRLEVLIDSAVAIAGSQRKLAQAMGVQQGHISEWRSKARSCPDKHILQMARIAGMHPLRTALEVYKERLGELARTLAIGVAVTLAALQGNDAAAYAGARSSAPNV
jgi:DNA-binding transcriptional regulator YdaS (Cro superfamily)